MIFILANGRHHAEYHAQQMELRPSEWQYLHEPHQLQGTQGARVVECYSWYEWSGLLAARIEQMQRVLLHTQAKVEHVQTWDERC